MALMPSPVLRWFVAAQAGTSGGLVPAAGYKAKFFDSGTFVAATIYTDAALTVPYSPANQATLDSEGKALIYLANNKAYRLQITTPADVQVWLQDNIIGQGAVGLTNAANFDGLKTVDTTLNQLCYIPGYYAAGDGGQGMFYVGAVQAG